MKKIANEVILLLEEIYAIFECIISTMRYIYDTYMDPQMYSFNVLLMHPLYVVHRICKIKEFLLYSMYFVLLLLQHYSQHISITI